MSGIIDKINPTQIGKTSSGSKNKVFAVLLSAILIGGGGTAVYFLNENNMLFPDADGNSSGGGGGGSGGDDGLGDTGDIDDGSGSTPPDGAVVGLDPVGWGYSQYPDYIVAARQGTALNYGVYNTTSAAWVTAWTSTNYTQTTLSALNFMTSGVLLLHNVTFNLALFNSIPEHVSVVENINGRERTFGNIADTQGSPYTISVEDTQYYAQDSIGTIRFASTNQTFVEESVFNALAVTGGKVVFNGLQYDGVVAIPSNVEVVVNYQGKTTTYGNYVANSNRDSTLKMYLPMDEAQGVSAVDYSMNNHTAFLSSGVTWGSGYYSTGLVFDSASDYFLVNDTASLKVSSLTLSFWIKPEAMPAGQFNYLFQFSSGTNNVVAIER